MRVIAKGLSVIFHPLFLICYVLAIVMVVNPYLFSIQEAKIKGLFLISTFLLSTFFPLVSIAMMRALGLISSITLEDRRQRIGPMIVTSIFYLWLFLNIKDNPGIPVAFSFFVLGSIIALFIAFFLNNFQKISLHSVGMGGFLMGILIIVNAYSYGFFNVDTVFFGSFRIHTLLLIASVLVVAGAVMTSRLLLGAHNKEELYGGFFVGAISQVIAFATYS